MKRFISISIAAAAALFAVSCTGFLKEDPKTFEIPENYYNNENEIRLGVNGIYSGTSLPINSTGLGGGVVSVLTEMLCGYASHTASDYATLTEILNLAITGDNGFAAAPWGTCYSDINRANSMIKIIETKEGVQISDAKRNQYLGEAYFLRAWYYSILVRLYGPVPLLTEPTTGFANAKTVPSSEKDVFNQIISDLEKAETLLEDTDWNNAEGRISKGAVKAFLAKMHLTMAGYPIQDASAYDKAYAKALEVVRSEEFSLYDTYTEARLGQDVNGKEYLFSTQCEREYRNNPMHMLSVARPAGENAYIPYISMYDATRLGGAWAPSTVFYNSYADGDKRTENHAFYYTSQQAIDGSATLNFKPFVYKYWNDGCAQDGKCGVNFPIIRYADVLLTLAEAACKGGSTTDAAAIDAYYQVRHRAVPSEAKPSTISFNLVFKERMWEQAFDGVNWFNMIRTRRTVNFATGDVVNLIGFKAPELSTTYEESDLLLPYPTEQVRLNPNLKR